MGYEVVWTDPALAAFETAVRYIADRNPAAAERVRIDLLDAVERLALLPYSGSAYDSDPGGRTREVVCRVYRIFYRVDDMTRRVEILTVWHGARREPDLTA
jgi:plasmid stabilization system protein ParE